MPSRDLGRATRTKLARHGSVSWVRTIPLIPDPSRLRLRITPIALLSPSIVGHGRVQGATAACCCCFNAGREPAGGQARHELDRIILGPWQNHVGLSGCLSVPSGPSTYCPPCLPASVPGNRRKQQRSSSRMDMGGGGGGGGGGDGGGGGGGALSHA